MGDKQDYTTSDLVDLAEKPSLVNNLSREALVRIVRMLLAFAFRDSLTQLWNRRFFTIRFQRMLKEAASLEGYKGCAALIIDLDGLKKWNDTKGHPHGDAFLRTTAAALQQALYRHKEDVVARIGGDEFGILLRNLGQQDAQRVVDRLVDTLQSHNVPASIGALYCPPMPELDGERIIARADKLMYKAKNAPRGTHRFVIAQLDVYTPTIVE